MIDTPRNPVAGMVPGIQYRSASLPFPKGSLLLLYTDGVTEAEEASLNQFGEEALEACFAQDHASSSALVTSLVKHVDSFANGHPQADDITLFALRRHP
jgi:sigma-B regulation protein RsbU (phosphoserine phosphatase)